MMSDIKCKHPIKHYTIDHDNTVWCEICNEYICRYHYNPNKKIHTYYEPPLEDI